jgi:hypothetical protein
MDIASGTEPDQTEGTDMTSFATDTVQDTSISAGMDYELHRYSATSWEILAIDYGKRMNRESVIARLTSEAEADVAWEQVMLASGSGRGVMHFVSATPSWEIKWFDEVTFKISSEYTRDEAEKDDLVTFYRDRAGFPVKVTETPIEHWSENPLFSADEN